MHRPSLFSNSHPLAFSSPAVTVLPSLRCRYKKQKLTTVHAEEPKVTREYREDDDSVVSASTGQPTEKNPNSMYIDEMPEVSNRALNACVAICNLPTSSSKCIYAFSADPKNGNV